MLSGRSFMKMRNRTGPRTDPKLKCLEKSSLSYWSKSAPVPERKSNGMSLNLQAYSTRYSNSILRMASYFEPYIMHFIEIDYMSCIPWLVYVMYSMAKTCLYMYRTKYTETIKLCPLDVYVCQFQINERISFKFSHYQL